MKADELQKVRRDNLKRLLEKHGGPTAVGKLLGYKGPSWLSQMSTGHKDISNDTARRIEEALGLRRYAMDHPEGEEPAEPGTVDRQLYSDALFVVFEELHARGKQLSQSKIRELADAVYEHAIVVKRVDRAFAQRLINLLP